MTIKWGDPIECNGVRPDWLRSTQGFQWSDDGEDFVPSLDGSCEGYSESDWSAFRAFKLPADHPAYVALARGFTPWSGGERAPDDWDGDCAPNILLRNGSTRKNVSSWAWRENSSRAGHATDFDVIGYRKRNTEPHLARIEVEGSAPVDGVFIKRMTEAEMLDRFGLSESTTPGRKTTTRILRELGLLLGDGCSPTEQPDYVRIVPFTRAEWDAVPDYTAWAQSVGLIRPESRAERFTRETGHAVTEAVEAALNWKES